MPSERSSDPLRGSSEITTHSTSSEPGALRALYERAAITWRLFWDGRVGILPKLIPVAAIAYLISPIDLAPALALGPLAPLGALDDVGVLLLALNLFIQATPPDLVREHLRELSAGRHTPPLSDADDDAIDSQTHDIAQ